MLQRMRAWFKLLPTADRDIPYMVVLGRMLTPQQMLTEVEVGSELGSLAQRRWEEGTTTSVELLEERIKRMFEAWPPDTPLIITPRKEYKPREILEMVKQRTRWGIFLLNVEEEYLKFLASLRERV